VHIKITSASEFERLLDALCNEAVTACVHFRLYKDLEASRREYAKAFHQSWTFWSLTFQSHWDTTLFRLCKIYDQHSASLNLRNLLDTIEQNIAIFDVENFRERLKDNTFVESLASGAKRPDPDDLRKDRETVSVGESRVKALVFWRNNFFAHRNAKHVAEKKQLADHYTFSIADVEWLLDNAMRVLNSYSVLFRASSYSSQIVGRDDYLHALRTIANDVRRHEEELERELQEIQQRNS
jgi:hypothetical protein